MQSQWIKERNKLSVATMKGILTLQYNFKDMCCSEFFSFLKSDKALLKRIRSQKNMHGQKSKFVVTWLTSVSLIRFKHIIATVSFLGTT